MPRRQGHRQSRWHEDADGVDVGTDADMVAVEAKDMADMMVLEQWLRTLTTVILKNKF